VKRILMQCSNVPIRSNYYENKMPLFKILPGKKGKPIFILEKEPKQRFLPKVRKAPMKINEGNIEINGREIIVIVKRKKRE
jgi:hypothetical protein